MSCVINTHDTPSFACRSRISSMIAAPTTVSSADVTSSHMIRSGSSAASARARFTGVPHGPNLAQQSLDAQVGKLAHTFGDVVDERIDHARSRCARTVTWRLNAIPDVFTNGLAVHTQSSGDGRNTQPLPMQF